MPVLSGLLKTTTFILIFLRFVFLYYAILSGNLCKGRCISYKGFGFGVWFRSKDFVFRFHSRCYDAVVRQTAPVAWQYFVFYLLLSKHTFLWAFFGSISSRSLCTSWRGIGFPFCVALRSCRCYPGRPAEEEPFEGFSAASFTPLLRPVLRCLSVLYLYLYLENE